MPRSPLIRLLATLVLVASLASSCGLGDDEGSFTPDPPTTAAAAMRVSLEMLFREHAFLLGGVTENAITKQAKPLDGASTALEENTLALGDRFEAAYGARGQDTFLRAWRGYTELLGQYAVRRAQKQKLPNVEKVFADAVGKLATFAAALTPIVNGRVFSVRMKAVVTAMRSAVDAQIAGDFTKADASITAASAESAQIAALLARAFADDFPSLYRGDPRTPSATYRAAIAGRLTEEVFLTGLTAENILTGQSKARDGAKAALDKAVAEVAREIAVPYGPDAEKQILAIWKKRNDLLIAYAGAAKDAAKRAPIAGSIEGYPSEAAAFFVRLNASLKASTLEQIIGKHCEAMAQAIDAQAAGDFAQADLRLRAAAGQIEALALAIAIGTVERFPARFRPTPLGF